MVGLVAYAHTLQGMTGRCSNLTIAPSVIPYLTAPPVPIHAPSTPVAFLDAFLPAPPKPLGLFLSSLGTVLTFTIHRVWLPGVLGQCILFLPNLGFIFELPCFRLLLGCGPLWNPSSFTVDPTTMGWAVSDALQYMGSLCPLPFRPGPRLVQLWSLPVFWRPVLELNLCPRHLSLQLSLLIYPVHNVSSNIEGISCTTCRKTLIAQVTRVWTESGERCSHV